MNRNSLLEISGRVMHTVQRVTLNQSNDNPMMQELHLDGMMGEVRSAIERVQHFGFTSTPLPRDEQQGGQSGAGGIAGVVSGIASSVAGNLLGGLKGPAAEAICLMVGGQRNHPVCIAVDDRRHRPMGLKPGENAQYDDLGQMTLLRRTGLFLLSSDDVQPQQQQGQGSQSSGSTQQQPVARMASLRHVQKQKQPRPGDKQSSSSGSQGVSAIARAAGATTQPSQNAQNFKHEGDTVSQR
jgi:phage gp45-like